LNHLINLSEAASLAFHGLALVAEASPDRINVKETAKRLNASEAHLAKVFQALNRAGILSSQRGPKGGFILSRSPQDISFLDVYEIVESPVGLGSCPLGYSRCGFHTCLFEQKLNHISREIFEVFKDIRLSQFTKTGARPLEAL